jgi:hypothetical protein
MKSTDLEVIIEFDPHPDKVDQIVKDLANFSMVVNNPLIMETFT